VAHLLWIALAVAMMVFVTYLPIGFVLFLLYNHHYGQHWVVVTMSLTAYTLLAIIFVRACRRRPYQPRPRRGRERWGSFD